MDAALISAGSRFFSAQHWRFVSPPRSELPVHNPVRRFLLHFLVSFYVQSTRTRTKVPNSPCPCHAYLTDYSLLQYHGAIPCLSRNAAATSCQISRRAHRLGFGRLNPWPVCECSLGILYSMLQSRVIGPLSRPLIDRINEVVCVPVCTLAIWPFVRRPSSHIASTKTPRNCQQVIIPSFHYGILPVVPT